jgi:hypothetical protein
VSTGRRGSLKCCAPLELRGARTRSKEGAGTSGAAPNGGHGFLGAGSKPYQVMRHFECSACISESPRGGTRAARRAGVARDWGHPRLRCASGAGRAAACGLLGRGGGRGQRGGARGGGWGQRGRGERHGGLGRCRARARRPCQKTLITHLAGPPGPGLAPAPGLLPPPPPPPPPLPATARRRRRQPRSC